MKVAICFSNFLFTEGIARLLDNVDEIEEITAFEPNSNSLQKVISLKPDVFLVDFTTLYNDLGGLREESGIKVVLLDSGCGEDNLTRAVITKGIKGILRRNTSRNLLVKSIMAVAKGEVWLDKGIVKNLVKGVNSAKRNEQVTLTTREREVVSLISKGYKNKEIASSLYISEPTVKTYLHRIYQKLDVRNRPQLITHVLNNPNISSSLIS